MIETIIEDEGWAKALPDADDVAKACYTQASAIASEIRGEIALLFTNNDKMRALNLQFRQKGRPD